MQGTGESGSAPTPPARHANPAAPCMAPGPSTALGSWPWPHTYPPFLGGRVHIYLLLPEPRALLWDTGRRPQAESTHTMAGARTWSGVAGAAVGGHLVPCTLWHGPVTIHSHHIAMHLSSVCPVVPTSGSPVAHPSSLQPPRASVPSPQTARGHGPPLTSSLADPLPTKLQAQSRPRTTSPTRMHYLRRCGKGRAPPTSALQGQGHGACGTELGGRVPVSPWGDAPSSLGGCELCGGVLPLPLPRPSRQNGLGHTHLHMSTQER